MCPKNNADTWAAFLTALHDLYTTGLAVLSDLATDTSIEGTNPWRNFESKWDQCLALSPDPTSFFDLDTEQQQALNAQLRKVSDLLGAMRQECQDIRQKLGSQLAQLHGSMASDIDDDPASRLTVRL